MTMWVGGDPKIVTLDANGATRQCRSASFVVSVATPFGPHSVRSVCLLRTRSGIDLAVSSFR